MNPITSIGQVSPKVQDNKSKFLQACRLGIDFGDKAHGVAVVKGSQVILAVTLIDESASDLKKRRELRRGRRTRSSRRQRLMRFRQWCLRSHLPDPDPYRNPGLSSILWPWSKNAQEKPKSPLDQLSGGQKKICHEALASDASWTKFLAFPQGAIEYCAIINPFIARRLAREGKASPLIFVRALWHLFEHRGFDWHRRTRGAEDDDFLDSKSALLQHLKSLAITSDEILNKFKERIKARDKEAAPESARAKNWSDDPKVTGALSQARERGNNYPIMRRVNLPRDYVEKELKECLKSLPLNAFPENYGKKKDSKTQDNERIQNASFEGLKKLLNWNRREPRFDNRQLRGCTWCAHKGIHRNTPRKINVIEDQIRAAIKDIKVSQKIPAMTANAAAGKKKAPKIEWGAQPGALSAEEERNLNNIFKIATKRENLKEKLTEFFSGYAKIPKQVFTNDGGKIRKQNKPKDPYQYHREELLNLWEGQKYKETKDSQYRKPAGRSRLCKQCLKFKAENPPEASTMHAGEAPVILSQRALRARCERLISWIKRNVRQEFPVEYIRIEAVLPRPEEKQRLKASAAEQEADQSPKEKRKRRFMEETGALCSSCEKSFQERERKGPTSSRDKKFCQCATSRLRAKCAYCLQLFDENALEIEHIYPKNPVNAAGGIGPNISVNLTISCRECNSDATGKGNRLPFDYFRSKGDGHWNNWKRDAQKFKWPKAKLKIALLEEYRLPPDLADRSSLARTSLVHRYLRQRLAEVFFSGNARNSESLNHKFSFPAGWMTSRCRLDWEHETNNRGHVIPLVPRKSSLRSEQKWKEDLTKRLANASDEKKKQKITMDFNARKTIEDALRNDPAAACDRTNLSHHWIDAAVLASLPPQANQPISMGGVWEISGKDVIASQDFAPKAAEFLKDHNDGSIIADLRDRRTRFTARQQETTLYGQERCAAYFLSKQEIAEAKKLPCDIFKIKNNVLEMLRIPSKNEGEKILEIISNAQLRDRVERLFKYAGYMTIREPVNKIKIKDAEDIVSHYWRGIFKKLRKQKYDFPKKKKTGNDESEAETDTKTEKRLPKDDEPLPAQAWEQWENECAQERRNKEPIPRPRHLQMYRSLGQTEKLEIKNVVSKRGIRTPPRTVRLTVKGDHAEFNPTSGALNVIINPWKSHVEKQNLNSSNGDPAALPVIRIFKGDRIWLPAKDKKKPDVFGNTKYLAGWHRITEMSPQKQKIDGIEPAKIKTEPAWLDLNQCVKIRQDQENDSAKRKKIKQDPFESPRSTG
ncbi:MAG TPA: RRXRR domain-containing protein [Elusimicrobiota bacterium]|nr:RRXRR domain-containing protein [Elusimicrobiota bacterium]